MLRHASATELLVAYWKVGSGRPSANWPESVDGALCVGWIDGIRRRAAAPMTMPRLRP